MDIFLGLVVILAICFFAYQFVSMLASRADKGERRPTNKEIDHQLFKSALNDPSSTLIEEVSSYRPRDSGSSTDGARYGRDDDRSTKWEGAPVVNVKARLAIKYRDASDEESERIVSVMQCQEPWYIYGHCESRGAQRTFRADRVHECVDVDTGEIVSDIMAFLLEKYENGPDRKIKMMMSGPLGDVATILFYVGKADGRLMPKEKKVLCDTVRALSGDHSLADEAITNRLSRSGIPSRKDFRSAVGRLKEHEAGAIIATLDAAERIIATQKTIHPEEAEAISYMKTKWDALLCESS